MQMHRSYHSIEHMCRLFQLSRSSYYHYLSEAQADATGGRIEQAVIEAFWRHKRRYGTRRLVQELADESVSVGRDRVRSILKRNGLQAIQPRSFVPRTTQSKGVKRSSNLLLDRALPDQVNQVWVGDITYLPLANTGWLYLSIWLDLCSRYIVGWQIEHHMQEGLVIGSLEKAVYKRRPAAGLIIHSDGGGQYGSKRFRLMLSRLGYKQSMSRPDNHYDNAFAESLFSRFKTELLQDGIFSTLEEARSECFDYIEGYYNTIRKHSSLGYQSPSQKEASLR